MIEPVLIELLAHYPGNVSVYVQDDPSFPKSLENKIDDTLLEFSYKNNIEIVPTLICSIQSKETDRTFGWDKLEWQKLTKLSSLGKDLDDFKPGCGSKTLEPGMEEHLAARFDKELLLSRSIQLADLEDEIESCYERGWSDGLPVVPPTTVRVILMLKGTNRSPGEIIGNIPPDNVPCSIEKVAINAVLAGCKPDYFPVVLD